MANRQQELMAKSGDAGQTDFIFYLKHGENDAQLLRYAPDGWNNAGLQLVRNKKYKGVFRKITINQLTFIKDGKDFLQTVYEYFGISAQVILIVQKLDKATFVYSDYFIGSIDFSTYRITDTGIDVQVLDNSLSEKVLNRSTIDVDITRNFTISGFQVNDIGSYFLTINEIDLIESAIYTKNTPDSIEDNSDFGVPMLLSISNIDDAQSQDITDPTDKFLKDRTEPDPRQYTIRGDMRFTVWNRADVDEDFTLTMYLVYGVTPYIIWSKRFTGLPIDESESFEEQFERSFTLNNGDGAKIYVDVQDAQGNIEMDFDQFNATVTAEGETINESEVIAYPFYEAFLKICQIIADDEDVFYSSFFGRDDTPIIVYPGDGQLGHITKGLFLRGGQSVNPTLPLSLEKLFTSLNALFNIGMEIDNTNGRVVIEEWDYFYEDTEVLDLSDRLIESDIDKEVFAEMYFNSINVGYNSFEYSMQSGIEEPNTKSIFTSIINIANSLELVSEYRGDTAGILELRISTGSDGKSTQGDENIFIIDSVRVGGGGFEARTDEDLDLPEYAGWYNLFWTPKRNLLRHGATIRASMWKDLSSYLRFQASDKNTKMVTQETGEDELREDADVLIDDLDEQIYVAEVYTFEVPFYAADLAAIEANPRGYITIADDKQGWLLDLTTDNTSNKATIKLIRKWQTP